MSKNGTPSVRISMQEHDELLRLAGLEPGQHGLSDLRKVLLAHKQLEMELENSKKPQIKALMERLNAIRF